MKIVSVKRRKFDFLKLVNNIFPCVILILFVSCKHNIEPIPVADCNYDNIEGEYLFFSETDTSTHSINIYSFETDKFRTNGIYGYGFWFPAASLSGEINDCEIVLDSYEDVKREGLSSPGGSPRYYYESMSGYGEYFSNRDSIRLFITYERTGDFTAYFNGEISLIKVD